MADASVVIVGSSVESTLGSVRATLQTAFSRQRPLYVNLLDDLGSSDSFVIDGDSLLLDCLGSLATDQSHGGQMLHLCYLAESFLISLSNCMNARFGIVFFHEHKRLWHGHQTSFLLLARQVLQQHLQQNLKLTVHNEFASWSSPRWLQYVKEVTHQFQCLMQLTYQTGCHLKSDLLIAGAACLPPHDRPVFCGSILTFSPAHRLDKGVHAGIRHAQLVCAAPHSFYGRAEVSTGALNS